MTNERKEAYRRIVKNDVEGVQLAVRALAECNNTDPKWVRYWTDKMNFWKAELEHDLNCFVIELDEVNGISKRR